MALSSFVGSFNTGTGAATTTVAVTGVGFQPKVILFWYSGRTESTDTVGRTSHYRGFGVACSTTDRKAICGSSIDSQASSDTQSGYSSDACINSVDATPTIDGALDLQSFDIDGFTLVVDDQMPRSLRVHFLALGGDSLTNAATGSFTEPGATGDQDITSLAFQPDCVLFFSHTLGADVSTGDTMMIGAATGASAQAVWTGAGEDARGIMDTASYCTAGECIARFSAANVALIPARADFVSFLPNGFRINWAERSANIDYRFLALKGGNYLVGNLLTQTDTVTDITEGSFGFKPSSALLVSHCTTESTGDTPQDNDRLSIGAFSGVSTRGVQAVLDEDGTADSEVTAAIEFDAVYANISTASAIQGLMDIKNIDSDGFTCIMDDADPAQAFVWYVAFGPAAAAGIGGPLLGGRLVKRGVLQGRLVR